MIAAQFILLAITLRIFAGLDYFIATWKGKAQPNPVTWLFWGIAPLVAFFAQLQHGIYSVEVWMSLILAIGPLSIFVVSLARRAAWRIGPFDILCGSCAAIGLILWQITNEPLVALGFSIAADIFGGMPTLVKIYNYPATEKISSYFLSAASMVITLLTITTWNVENYVFPLYIMLINVVIVSLGLMGIKRASLKPQVLVAKIKPRDRK